MINLLFPDFVYVAKEEKHEEIKNKYFTKDVLESLENTKYWDCKVLTSHNNLKNIFNKDSYIKNIVKQQCMKMFEEIGSLQKNVTITFPMDSIWMNLYNKGSWQDMHHHAENISNFSFVYFLNFNLETDAKLVFVNERFSHYSGKGLNKLLQLQNANIAYECTMSPDEGCIVIFPNHLNHKVELQKEDTRRCTISGNFMVSA